MSEIFEETVRAAALGIHCRMSIGRGNFIAGATPAPTNEDLAHAALEAALPALRKQWAEEVAKAVEAGADAHNLKIAHIAGVPHRPRDGMVSSGIRRAASIVREYGETAP